MSKEDRQNLSSNSVDHNDQDDINWVDQENVDERPTTSELNSEVADLGMREFDTVPAHTDTPSLSSPASKQNKVSTNTVVMVETAFLASAASLVWLINFYFPVGPVLKIFFPIPIALIYLRRGNRAAWMTAIVSGLLLLVLMGPTRSVIFLMPYGLMGVLLGACWQRQTSWLVSITLGAAIGSLGLFFRFWLTSILVGENLWVYTITQITQLADWIFFRLGILAQPNFILIQTLAFGLIIVNNLVYLFAVHLVALMMLDRLDNPISRPPEWVRILLDY
ncbi:MAG: DUF2232 domain-containing protein [Cyanobacteria bacterium P01_A01_bin.83]